MADIRNLKLPRIVGGGEATPHHPNYDCQKEETNSIANGLFPKIPRFVNGDNAISIPCAEETIIQEKENTEQPEQQTGDKKFSLPRYENGENSIDLGDNSCIGTPNRPDPATVCVIHHEHYEESYPVCDRPIIADVPHIPECQCVEKVVILKDNTPSEVTLAISSIRLELETIKKQIKNRIDSDEEIDSETIKKYNEAIKEVYEELSRVMKDATAFTESINKINVSLSGDELHVTDKNGTTSTINVKGPKGESTPTSMSKYTMEEYLSMKERGEIYNMLYSVYKDEELYRLYLGETLIMKKSENGEEITIGSAFPLVFPIIFS